MHALFQIIQAPPKRRCASLLRYEQLLSLVSQSACSPHIASVLATFREYDSSKPMKVLAKLIGSN